MKKNIIFTTIFALVFSVSQVSAQDSTQSGDIREKIQEKVQAALNKPKSYMGTVTDVAETTLQLKNLKGEIKQISSNKETTISNIISTPKSVNFSDIAIGDFIVAMGYVNTNSVLDTKRILVTSPLENVSRKSYLAKIDTYSKNSGSANLVKDGTKITFATNANTKYQMLDEGEITQAKSTSVKASSRVIMTGIEETNSFIVRRILVIQ